MPKSAGESSNPLVKKDDSQKKHKKGYFGGKASKHGCCYRICRAITNVILPECVEIEDPVYSFDVKKIYWDIDGNLRQGTSDRKREEELLRVIESDAGDDNDPDFLWMIIPSHWIRNWLLFAHLKLSSDPPGPIDLGPLIKRDDTVEGGWRPKNTLLPPSKTKIDTGDFAKIEYDVKPGHFRRIPYDVWETLIDLYGTTDPAFCIAVKGNTPKSPANDFTRWKIFQTPLGVNESELPEPELENKVEDAKATQKKKNMFAAMGFS